METGRSHCQTSETAGEKYPKSRKSGKSKPCRVKVFYDYLPRTR